MSLVLLGVGLVGAVAVIRGGLFGRRVKGRDRVGLAVWAIIWNTVSVIWVVSTVTSGSEYVHALKSGQCEVVEGVVEVLHEQPATGHDSGDRIRIGGKEFVYSKFRASLAYRQTIAHGGHLRNGVYARLHTYGDAILKVEIRQSVPIRVSTEAGRNRIGHIAAGRLGVTYCGTLRGPVPVVWIAERSASSII